MAGDEKASSTQKAAQQMNENMERMGHALAKTRKSFGTRKEVPFKSQNHIREMQKR